MCVTSRLDLPEPGCVSFQKWGKHGRPLLCQLGRWDAKNGRWLTGFFRLTAPRVPNYLIAKIEAILVAEFAEGPQSRLRPVPGGLPVAVSILVHRTFANASEAVSVGGMSFLSFLAMELVEAHDPAVYRRHTPQAH